MVHSIKRSKKSRYGKGGYDLAKLAHGPWCEHPRALEKTQALVHQRLHLSDTGWHPAWIPPALPFCTSSCNQYVTRICKPSKKYKNMVWVFFFFFLQATCSLSMWSPTLCVANPINKTVKHLSCNWIPAHDKEQIWSTTNSWEEHSILALCFTARPQLPTNISRNFCSGPKRRRGGKEKGKVILHHRKLRGEMVFATVLLWPNTTGEQRSSILIKLKCKISEGFYEIRRKTHKGQLSTLSGQKALT